jgi:hypothetical protein
MLAGSGHIAPDGEFPPLVLESLGQTANALLGARVDRAYVDMRHPDGDVDVVVVAGDCALTLRGGCTRATGHERWTRELSFEDCQRWLVGAEVVDLVSKDAGRSLTLWLSNGVVLTGAPD